MATNGTHTPPTLIYQPGSYVEPLCWARVFPQDQPVEIELGSGDGSFLVAWARQHPDCNFLGVERLKGRLRKLDRKGRRAGLVNLRGLRLEASYCIAYLVPPGSVRALHIYFPDPWPKRKHERHRLVNPRFADEVARVLAANGSIFLRTDDRPYFLIMNEVFAGHSSFGHAETPGNLATVKTDFENEFIAQGRETFHIAFRRIT